MSLDSGWVRPAREPKPRPWPLAWTLSWCAMAFLFGGLAGYQPEGLDIAGRVYDWIAE